MKSTIVDEWLKAAASDLAVIEKISDQALLTHMVAFHAQQCIEKCLKAAIEQYELAVPKTHSLDRLFQLLSDAVDVEGIPLTQETIDLLDDLYIDSRYPGEMGLLPDGLPSKEQAENLNEAARACHLFISGKLKR